MSGRYGQSAREFREARARALLERPELFADWPADVPKAWAAGRRYLTNWNTIVDFLKERGLVSKRTQPIDVSVDKIVRLAQQLQAEASHV